MKEDQPLSELRILHLEDNETDVELIRNVLSRGGITCQLRAARSRDQFAAALREGSFDLILSDYTLPSFDGAAALALAREIQPGTPFMYVSGTIGEERAVESLKGGAVDYVLKQRLERLVPAVVRAMREVAEKRRREEAEAKYQSIFENALEGIFQSSPDGHLITANPAMARLCGYDSPREMMAEVRDLAGQLYVDPARRMELRRLLDEKGTVAGMESRIRRKDGREIWITEHARAVRDSAGRLLYYEGTLDDITAHREAEEALKASEERFREMAESIRDVFVVTSPDGKRLIYVSPAYEKIWGRSRAELGNEFARWIEAVVPEDRGAVTKALGRLAAGAESQVQYRVVRPDGATCWIEDRGYPVRNPAGELVRVLRTASDITERKTLEEQLLQSQKMEAIGQLAGGVAHDFNNVLTVINGYARLLLDQGDFPPQAEERLRQIYAAGIRAGNLIRQLLLFSRKHAANKQVVAFNPHIEEIAKLIRRLIGEDIRLDLNLAPELPPVYVDEGMMEQVLMNLAVNARDAMPRGGRLLISTEPVNFSPAAVSVNSARRAGDFIGLAIRDSGGGIPPEVLPKIFEPFFTTKEAGVGTGLGLATVFGIVQQHEGWIEVDTQVGAGTCFRIYLPPAATPVVERAKTIPPFAGQGSETILLVEDEAPVREFVVAVLEHFGYRVLQAGSGVQALEVWKWHSSRIALLLTDLVMPDGMTGVELAKTLRAEKPGLRIIFTSGYSSAMTNQVFGLGGQVPFLQKPYLPAKLAGIVRETLDNVPASTGT